MPSSVGLPIIGDVTTNRKYFLTPPYALAISETLKDSQPRAFSTHTEFLTFSRKSFEKINGGRNEKRPKQKRNNRKCGI